MPECVNNNNRREFDENEKITIRENDVHCCCTSVSTKRDYHLTNKSPIGESFHKMMLNLMYDAQKQTHYALFNNTIWNRKCGIRCIK